MHNTTPLTGRGARGLDRPAALRASLLSTQVVVRPRGGRFVSPLEREGASGGGAGCENVNTWPVLAAPEDDAVLGAAIILPDHPSRPESHGDLFDNTEIEEALLLHVQALCDAEREEIASRTRRCARWSSAPSATTPEEIIDLHGLMRSSDPRPRSRAEPGAPRRGASVDGRRAATLPASGGKVVLRPGTDGDPYDGCWTGARRRSSASTSTTTARPTSG